MTQHYLETIVRTDGEYCHKDCDGHFNFNGFNLCRYIGEELEKSNDRFLRGEDCVFSFPIRKKDVNQLTLGQLIKLVEKTHTLKEGLYEAHSYRGYYEDLAFVIKNSDNSSNYRRQTLKVLKGCLDRDFTGYKGGEYIMDEDTKVWVAYRGHSDGQKIIGLEDGKFILQRDYD